MKEKNQVVPDEVLSKEFLSQFKTEADVSKFLKQLHAQVLEKMLEGEMDAHLGYEKNSVAGNNSGNSRNGNYPKKIQTEHGEAVISIPRDRNGQFEPIAVPKHESRGLSIEKLVISLYAKGMSVSDIEEEMREIYEIELSTSAISIITNKVNQAALEWQNRPLDPVYLIVWMDGIVFKVRDNGKIINKTVYLCVGLKQNGLKEVLGMWVGKSESSSFWMGVLTDLKARGVQDILITCTDNLNGFTDTIRTVFPQSATQICVVHQIRNSCKKREFDIKLENRQLSVIDKVYINGGLLFKKAICCYSRQRVGYKVIERTMSGVFYLCNVLQLVIDRLNQGPFSEQNLVGNAHQRVLHIVFNFSDKLNAIKEKVLEQSLANISFVCT